MSMASAVGLSLELIQHLHTKFLYHFLPGLWQIFIYFMPWIFGACSSRFLRLINNYLSLRFNWGDCYLTNNSLLSGLFGGKMILWLFHAFLCVYTIFYFSFTLFIIGWSHFIWDLLVVCIHIILKCLPDMCSRLSRVF